MDIDISNIDGDEGELLQSNFNRSFARFNGYVMFDELKAYVDSLSKMNVRDDDIWVCTYPKTGTTWTQEMVYCVANDVDLTKARRPLNDRYIFIDKCFLVPEKMASRIESEISRVKKLFSSSEPTESDESPRFIHTHLPFELLPQKIRDGSTKAKIIYVVRNPRDTCISFYHHRLMTGRYNGNLKNFSELFVKDLVSYGPFWKHVFAYWNRRNDENVLFIKYEDMKKDLPSVIKRTATFLEKNVTNDQMGLLCDHLSFESMKNNPFVNEKPLITFMKNSHNPEGNGGFFRKGTTDQWKNDFDSEIIKCFDQWEYENLKHFNLKSYYEL